MSATDVPPAVSPAAPPPVEPVQPDLDDCCNRGCYPCVFDVYDEAMDRYRAALKIWEKQNPAAAAKRKAKPK
jgi:Oxidoreductase-like protein, N-terminal